MALQKLAEAEDALRRERDRADLYEAEVERLRRSAAANSLQRSGSGVQRSPSTSRLQQSAESSPPPPADGVAAARQQQQHPIGDPPQPRCVGSRCSTAVGGGNPLARCAERAEVREEDSVVIPRREFDLLQLKERAMDAIKEGITIADCSQPDMPIIYANEAFSRVTGYRCVPPPKTGVWCRGTVRRHTQTEGLSRLLGRTRKGHARSGRKHMPVRWCKSWRVPLVPSAANEQQGSSGR